MCEGETGPMSLKPSAADESFHNGKLHSPFNERPRKPPIVLEGDGHVGFVKFDGAENDMSNYSSKNPFSELELHVIKTGFMAIEALWKDVSMGSDEIPAKLLKNIHGELGEIGSELFKRIFYCRILPDQVCKNLCLYSEVQVGICTS
jgi:hypothetical protein